MFNKVWSIIAVALVAMACAVSKTDLPMTLINLSGIIFVLGVAQSWKHANLFGLIFSAALGVYSYQVGYISNAIVQLAFIVPMSAWGWYNWCTRDKDGVVQTQEMNSLQAFTMLVVGLIVFGGFTTLSFLANASLPILDGLTATLPIMATILLINAYKEQWYVWIAFNGLSVYMWLMAASTDMSYLSILVLKVVFLVNSLIGYFNWNNK